MDEEEVAVLEPEVVADETHDALNEAAYWVVVDGVRAFWHVVPLAGDGSSEDACEEMEEQVLDAYEAWLYEVENAEAHEPDLAD